MNNISFPFRIQNRRIATVSPGSNSSAAQKILAAFRTEPGELLLFPAFGMSDPLFDRITWAEFFSTMSTYYSDIEITSFVEKLDDSGQIIIDVEFQQSATTPE